MNSIRCYFKTWDRIFTTLLVLACMIAATLLISSSQSVMAQTGPEPGDYRSAGSGIWNDTSTWEVWDGDSWESATAWPGQDEGDDYTVTLQSGHVISDNNVGTLYFGDLIVLGHLELSSNLYLASTSHVLVDGIDYDGSDITTGGSIRWLADIIFNLPTDAILNIINVKDIDETVIDGLGLYAPVSPNNNKRLAIGNIDYAAANIGGTVEYSFDEINEAGGALAAITTASPIEFNYEGSTSQYTITLNGEATGLGSGPEYTTFTWTGSGPNAFSFSYNGQNPGQVDIGDRAGLYSFTLNVTSTYRDFTYSTSQDAIVTVHHANLYITAFDQSKVFGDESFTLNQTEFSVTGLKDSDTVASVSLSSDGEYNDAAAGEYDIIPGEAAGEGLENYLITYVNGILTIIPPGSIAFEVSNLEITPSNEETWNSFTFTRKTGQEVIVTVDVTNTGVLSGTYHGILKVDGNEISRENITLSGDITLAKDITLEPGESGQLTFILSNLPAGDYSVEIGDLNGDFYSDNWDNWWLFATLILTAVFIIYVVKRFGYDGERLNWSLEEEENEE